MPKNVILVSVQKARFAVQACKKPCFMQRHKEPTVQICGNSGLFIAMVTCLHQWNVYTKKKIMVYSVQNVIRISVQQAHFAVRACKEPCFIPRRIGPTVQICGNSRLPIAMVRCLHQWNVYIKRKISVCRAQKCNPRFGAKSPLRSTGL